MTEPDAAAGDNSHRWPQVLPDGKHVLFTIRTGLLAVLTVVGGGIMRDIVRGDSTMPALKGSMSAVTTILWAFLLALFLHWETDRLDLEEIFLGVALCVACDFPTRLTARYSQLRAPMF